jgi:hypothetical protein
MAKVVLTNSSITFQALDFSVTPPVPVGATYDLSDHISSITLSTVHDIVETTEVGQVYKRVIAGLGTNSVNFEFYQDFATNTVEDVIYPWIGTRVLCKVKPSYGAVSSTNPQYQFQVLITEWTPLNAGVGQISTANVSWPINGPITKTTTP